MTLPVKVQRVFPSSFRGSRIFTGNSISLNRHWRQWRSRYIIQQDGTYPPRHFATLGPSELQPPFTWESFHSANRVY